MRVTRDEELLIDRYNVKEELLQELLIDRYNVKEELL